MMQQFLSALGYQFKNPALLRRALTHPSMGPEDNQRLEFLGDAVLQYIMSDILYQSHPDCHEGQLTHLRALSVCEANLSQVAKKLHVGEALIMDKGEELTGGREKPSVLCDAMEAILAAVYLDGGLDAARAIILRCWPKPEDVQRPMQDSKGALQEFFGKDRESATQIMLKIHLDGRGVCGVYSQDVAATKVEQVLDAAQIAGHPLQATFEPVE